MSTARRVAAVSVALAALAAATVPATARGQEPHVAIGDSIAAAPDAYVDRFVALALPAAPPAPAGYRIDGHGYGHGVGMAQYGAYGYAREQGRSFRWILGHYYPGTRVAAVPASRIRVRLKELSALRVSSADLATATGRRVTLHSDRTYRLSPWVEGLQLMDLSSGRTVARLPAPVRLSPGRSPLRLLGLAENGVRDGRYRGALYLHRDGERVLAVDDVALEDYLLGVVPSEMPASWPREALRAQAVVARSFALTTRRPSERFDVYADTRSQAYRGLAGEASAATAAARDTRGLGVLAGGQVAATFFHASSGGRTAAVQEVFAAAAPVPYLVSVEDPFDRLSPYHDWSVTLSDDEMARRLGAVVPGTLLDVAVAATTPTGRVATVRVTGTLGARDLDGPSARTLLGLRSTWFTVSR